MYSTVQDSKYVMRGIKNGFEYFSPKLHRTSDFNLGAWPAGAITLPTAKYHPHGAHTAHGHSNGQGNGGFTKRRAVPTTKYLFSNVNGFAETSSSPTTSFTDVLTSRKRNISRPQRKGTYEGMTSRYVTVVSVYSGGKQPTP